MKRVGECGGSKGMEEAASQGAWAARPVARRRLASPRGRVGWMLVMVLALADMPARAQFELLAAGGDPVPGGGTLFLLDTPVMQAPGAVFFSARIDVPGTDPRGLFRARPAEPLEILARQGDPAPDGNGNFPSISGEIFANEAGAVAFGLFFENSLGGFDDSGALLISDPATGDLSILVRGEDPVPGSAGDVFAPLFGPFLALDNRGQMAFAALEVNAGTNSLWRGSAAPGSLTRIVTEGTTAPGGGIHSDFFVANSGGISINAAGEVAFLSLVSVPGDALQRIYRGNGGPLVEVVGEGDPAPSGDGTFNHFAGLNFSRIRINEHNEIAFLADLNDTAGGTSDNTGVFLAGPGGVLEVARRGDPVPDGNGFFLIDGFAEIFQLSLNNLGQVAFGSRVSGAANGATDGLFLWNGSGIVQIARLNQAAPGGGVIEEFLDTAALDDQGQLLFWALVDIGEFNPTVVPFFWDGGELVEIAREGDVLPGLGTLTSFTVPAADQDIPERSLLNERGQVALEINTS
ncbi:MAG: hypothetical protein MI919_03120, partial [Holophagales bacterium]|nr:hypothetical protein [Holophagales bacterium]